MLNLLSKYEYLKKRKKENTIVKKKKTKTKTGLLQKIMIKIFRFTKLNTMHLQFSIKKSAFLSHTKNNCHKISSNLIILNSYFENIIE